MATTHPTLAAERAARDADIRQRAAAGASARSIARETGLHHTTVARIIRTAPAPEHTTVEQVEPSTPEPSQQTERATPAPPAPTSGDRHTPPRTALIRELAPDLIRDLNVLVDRRTGALPAPLAGIVRAYADRERARWSAALERRFPTEQHRPSGRAPARAQVAP
ncbi:hypothetical protein [Streptomyces similanensis]|uniref:Helix-turn-helix domain-containing protein n=1 Tax=Streptomyces similanensis TaxID=1274988 RepID=A0ABP9KFT9_9ACTN